MSRHGGAIGALGSVPGTVCAHPLDVLKIRHLGARLAAGAGGGGGGGGGG